MKGLLKRILAVTMVACMVLTLMPNTISASTTVTPNTGSASTTDLEVEYFSSTLYNWDESAANEATALVDQVGGATVSWSSTTVNYSQSNPWSSDPYSTYENSKYYVLVDENYYKVTDISCTRTNTSGSGGGGGYPGDQNYTYSWTIAYDGGSTTSSDSSITLYYQDTSAISYEGKGFYFTSDDAHGVDSSSIAAFSYWSGSAQNYYIYSGLAASKLSESSNAPFKDETVNAANLFATDGSNEDYADVYTNVQVPFVYDSETGYYTLDSDKYAVYFTNGAGESGATMEIADLPAGYSANVASGSICGFAPFNAVNLESTGSYVMGNSSSSATTTGYTISGSMNYGFGMVTSIDFQMTDDGKIDGEDIIFEFSGDDDVWVYIDDVLVLDIGGTHDAINGTINFSTGEVTLTAPKYNQIGDKATDSTLSNPSSYLSQTNLYTALGTTLTGFASQGEHTMTIYYMDRGQGATNCLIRFNLPQEDSLSVTKEIATAYTNGTTIDENTLANLSNIDFTFTLYHDGAIFAGENYSLHDANGNFVQNGSTDSNGQFTLKNGYTAVFEGISLDEAGTWNVVENLSSTRWVTTSTYTATINSDVTTGSGNATGGTVTLNDDYIGSGLSTDHIVYTFTNQYVKGADPDVDVYDETIVLDYGLPVEVDVTANDITTMYGSSIGEEYSPVYELALTDATDGKYVGNYGYAEISDNKIVYTLTEDFCGIETVNYTYSVQVTVDGGTKSGTATGTLTIIPATSVYYEEDFSVTSDLTSDVTTAGWNGSSHFITISTNNAEFSVEGSSIGGYQETGFVGTTDDSTYGTDAIYLDNLGDSYGTSLKVDTSAGAAQYKYTFTGMGTTIYGRVSSTTAYIKVTVNAVDGEGNETLVDTQVIDTINLVTAVEDDEEETILDDELFNIPIYQNNALDNGYDTYVVRIYVYTGGTNTGLRESGGEFYLDGIRVYKPMGDSTEDNKDYETAASAYATDGEANVAVVNIRTKMVADIEAKYTSDIFTLTDINGEIDDVDTYNDIGPNEEFYLKEGYSLEFALVNWNSQSYKIYLGMKAPNGKASEVTVGTGTFEIGNSADCYYDISDYVEVTTLEDGTVVGCVAIEGNSGLTALTNIKITGVDTFNLAYAQDYSADNEEDEDESTGDEATETTTLYMVSTAYAADLSKEEEEEVAVFEPSSISVSCNYASKTKKATVNVVTSKDVSYVTINGVKVGAKTVSGKYRFTASYTKVTAGTTYEIIAYDADGVASQVYTVTAQ